jgi:hypothetical protein
MCPDLWICVLSLSKGTARFDNFRRIISGRIEGRERA